jgi:hypothetical protein
MPLLADVPRFAPPSSAVVVPAALNVPTFLTSAAVEVVVRSTRKSAGNVAVAVVPIPSKFCVAGADVDSEIAAWRTTKSAATAAVQATSVRTDLERMELSE